MKNIFNSIQIKKPNSNVFDLSHDFKFSARMGTLIPTLAMEVLPGDNFKIGCESLIRFAPLTTPVMHRMDCTMHYFFVPNRLLWENWEDFITDKTSHAFPTVPVNSTDDQTKLANYLGIPQPVAPKVFNVSALPFAAYQMIYNEYYRDQNLIPEVNYKLVDGNNSANADLKVFRGRAWEHDYFTSALPTAQAGNPVSLPGGQVILNAGWAANGDQPKFVDAAYNTAIVGDVQQGASGGQAQVAIGSDAPLAYDPNGSLETPATNINDLRRAFRLQEWLEKSMRSGQRYIENILAHFGVRSSDARLQRPEYITGTKSPVVISEVLNTTGETGGLPQGNQAGHAISVTNGNYGGYRAEEHGYIIGIMSVLPKTAYQQGLPRHFSKEDFIDFAWPEFANIGEQEILNKEIFLDSADPEGTFGYIPRYSEYKYMPSRVAGQFQTTLQDWHMGRIFSSEPLLNQDFVTSSPTKRIFAVTSPTDDELYCHVMHNIKANRRLPFYGTPTF